MYEKDRAATASAEVNLLRVLSSTLNTENEKLAEQLRQAKIRNVKIELRNEELEQKIAKRTKVIVIVSAISLAVITLLSIN